MRYGAAQNVLYRLYTIDSFDLKSFITIVLRALFKLSTAANIDNFKNRS